VVESKQQIEQYGRLIGNQTKQLVGLVERILLFAATRDGNPQYTLVPLEVRAVVDAAVADAKALVEAEGFEVEAHVAPGLPRMIGEAGAVAQCLQNLITNALKYGREQRWVGIQAMQNPQTGEVEIRVSDRGIGISAADLPHIFEPFYRSPSVRDAQIHGTGLGLTIARSLAQAMHGRIEVKSTPGQGSSFSLVLPSEGTRRS
jgi:signal transduction histidine kinase